MWHAGGWHRALVLVGLLTVAGRSTAQAAEPFSLARWHAELRAVPAIAGPAPDPLRSFNQMMFDANAALAASVLVPAGRRLDGLSPPLLKEAAANVYGNLVEVKYVVTNLMAGQLAASAASAGRFLLNSTVGLGGVWDPASRLGLGRRETSFAEALCAVGLTPGHYLVLPLVGSTDVTTATLVSGVSGAQIWVIGLASPALAIADLVLDVGIAAAALGDVANLPDGIDPYGAARDRYGLTVKQACGGGL